MNKTKHNTKPDVREKCKHPFHYLSLEGKMRCMDCKKIIKHNTTERGKECIHGGNILRCYTCTTENKALKKATERGKGKNKKIQDRIDKLEKLANQKLFPYNIEERTQIILLNEEMLLNDIVNL